MVQPHKVDVLIVGAGAIGASIAFHLSGLGITEITVCDHNVPRSATRVSGGLVRMYHPDADMVRLNWESYKFYIDWEDNVGGDCGFERTGFTFVPDPAEKAKAKAVLRVLHHVGVPALQLSADDLAQLQPFCRTDALVTALYEPNGGYAQPLRVAHGFLNAARRHGIRLLTCEVTRLLRQGNRIVGVAVGDRRIESGLVVLASNASTKALAITAGIDLPLKLELLELSHFEAAPDIAATLFTSVDEAAGIYYRRVGRSGVMIGVNLNAKGRGRGDAQEALTRAQMRIPGLAGAGFIGSASAQEAFTPDHRPMIGPLPGLEGLYVAAGFSGGGFKLAPAAGRLAAEEIASTTPAAELERLRPARFATLGTPRPAVLSHASVDPRDVQSSA
jgi:glycine/D-amino acid oxidase-like deaminating enzyme